MEELLNVFNHSKDEDFDFVNDRPPKKRRKRPRIDFYAFWGEEEFFCLFSLHKDTITEVPYEIRNLIINRTNKNLAFYRGYKHKLCK